MSKNLQGIIWMLAGCLGSAIMFAIVRHITESMNPYQALFLRNLFALFLFIPWVIKTGFKNSFKTGNLKLNMVRAVIGYVAMMFLFIAISENVPLTTVTAISFVAPIIAIIMAMIILKEKSNVRKWIAVFLGFFGAMIVLRPGMEGFNSYAWLVFAATFLWGNVAVIIKIITRTDTATQVTYYMAVTMTILAMPLAIIYWENFSYDLIWWFIALGLVSNIFQIALSKAFSLAEISIVQPIDFSRIIFIAIISYFAFGEVIDGWTLIGSIIIMSGVVYTAIYEARTRRRRKKRISKHEAALEAID